MADEIATLNTSTGDVSVVNLMSDTTSFTSENTVTDTTNTTPEVVKEDSLATENVVENSATTVVVDKPTKVSTPVVAEPPKVESPKLEEAPIEKPSNESSFTDRSNESAVTESNQLTRLRRNKRDVSGSSTPMRTYYSTTEYVTTDSSNIQEVNKIDYTTSKNPSPAEVGKGIYNNQIESIEQLPTNTPNAYRFRIKLKDGESLPDGGKLLLSSLGLKEPVSADLFIGTDKIGVIKTYSAEYNPDSITNRLNKTKDVDSYIALFESMKPTDQPLTSLVLEFNKNFSTYNKNRLVEFELNWSKYTVVDHLIKSNGSEKQVITGTNGVDHVPEKTLKGYLLNPYDTKAITAGTTVNLVQLDNPPQTFSYANNLWVSSGWVGVTKPYYFDDFFISAPKQFEVLNRDLSSSPIVGHANDTFKFEVPENSLFATTGYNVGDIVELDGRDFTTPKEEVTPNRFTNSNKFATTKTGEYKTRKIKVRFQLVEKTDRSYTWKLVNDLVLENAQLDMDVKKLFPFQPRRDWMSRFGENKLKEFLSGTSRDGSPYLTNNQLQSTLTTNIGGVEKSSSGTGEIHKNVNILFGEATTGSVKVVHKTDAGVTLKEEVVATNKPWYTPINLDPATFEGYQFVSSSETLSTLVGQGDRTIELVYAKPSETVDRDYLPTKYIVDNTKDGTYRNIVEGSPTVTTVRKEYIYSPITRTSTPKYTTTKEEGKPMVVTIGSKPTTEVTYQDFTTRYVADPTRTAGEKFTETAGVRGTTTIETTYSVNKETGEVTPMKGQSVVVAPKEAVIKVGTKPTIVETTIPVTTTYKADNSLDYGKESVESQGQAGTRTVTTPKVLNTQDGTVSDGQPTTKETPMTPKVVKKGTKPTVTEKPINFTTVYEADETKENGVRTDKAVGVQGKVITTTTYTLNESTGNITVNTPTERREEPTNKVVLVGTKPKVETQTIEITTKYVEDTTLEAGKEVEVEKGSVGRTVTTTTYVLNTVDGTVTANKPTVETTPMFQRILKVGIKPKVDVEKVARKVTYLADATKEFGFTEVKTEGSDGSVTTTTTYTVNKDGSVSPNTPTKEVVEAVTKIVVMGTKPKVTVEKTKYTTSYEEDDTLTKGETKVKVQGKEGVKTTTITYTLDTELGVVKENKPTVEEVEVVNEIISVGTKPEESSEPIPYTTEYRPNTQVEKGETSVKTKGENGKTTTTVTYKVDKTTGKVTEKDRKVDIVSPKNEVVEIGNKPTTEVVVIPSVVRYVPDTSKKVGSDNETTKGKDGSKSTTTTYNVDPKTGKITEVVGIPVITDQVETVVKVGAKPKEDVTETPVETEYVDTPDLYVGEEKVISEGTPGSVTKTTSYTVNEKTGEVTENKPWTTTVPMKKRVVHRGTNQYKASVVANYYLEGTTEKLQESKEQKDLVVGTTYKTSSELNKAPEVTKEVKDGKETTTTVSYELVSTPENAEGKVVKEGVVVNYYYKRVVTTVVKDLTPEKPQTPEKPETPEKPQTPEKPEVPQKPQEAPKPTEKPVAVETPQKEEKALREETTASKRELPNTGTSESAGLGLLSGLGIFSALGLLTRRKSSEED
jgi:LPXTG-motif cell wall-anchored protein